MHLNYGGSNKSTLKIQMTYLNNGSGAFYEKIHDFMLSLFSNLLDKVHFQKSALLNAVSIAIPHLFIKHVSSCLILNKFKLVLFILNISR